MPAKPPTSKYQTVSLPTSARSYSSSQDPTGSRVDRTNTATDDPAPSLHPHYRGFTTTTSRSASAPRDGTHTRHEHPATPSRRRNQFATNRFRHAVSRRAFPRFLQEPQTRLMPPQCRTPPGQKPGHPPGPAPAAPPHGRGFDATLNYDDTSTAVRGYSSSWSPPDTSTGAFSTSLTTTVFSQRSMWWFEASARPATSKGQPSSLAAHRFPKVSPTYIETSVPRSWHTSGSRCRSSRRHRSSCPSPGPRAW